MRGHRAPRVATWLLDCFLSESTREVILGDLVEEYGIRHRAASTASPARWYWGQVWRSIPPLLWIAVRRGAWLTTVGVGVVAYIVAGTMEFVGVAVISSLLGPDARPLPILSAIVGLATMVLGGYFAAAIRPRAATVMAGIILAAVAILMVTASGSAPLWYGLTFLTLGPLAALVGGMLRVRAKRFRSATGWRGGHSA